MYFARMKRQNRDGVPLLMGLPRPKRLNGADLAKVDGRTTAVIDTRPWPEFRAGHAAGALFAPFDKSFLSIVGSYVEPEEPIVLILEPEEWEEAVRALVRIGLDNVGGVMPPAEMAVYESAGGPLDSTEELDAQQAGALLGGAAEFFLDVRRADEFAGGHIPSAVNVAHTRLPAHLDALPRDKRLIVNCQGGVRSARACAYLQRRGFEVANMRGGFAAWRQAAGKVATPA